MTAIMGHHESIAEYSYAGVVLRIRNVSLQYDDTLVLRDITQEVHDVKRPGLSQGQVVGLLGPSGCGKTSLFKVMAGLQVPTAGLVTLGAGDFPVRRGAVGVVAQHYPLFAHRTVLGNLLVAGRQTVMPRDVIEAKAQQLLAEFQLADRMHHYPAQLSGGQRQRVAIAQQLMCSDFFLLMDEPFSGLDPLMEEKVIELIHQVALKHDHNTIIVVTHNIEAAVAVADTIWLMGRERGPDGKIIPGARIVETHDLAALGIAWKPDIRDAQFREFVLHLRSRFHSL